MISGSEQSASAALVLALLALFVFASPFTDWWAGLGMAWYVPYLMWLALTALTALISRRTRRHDV